MQSKKERNHPHRLSFDHTHTRTHTQAHVHTPQYRDVIVFKDHFALDPHCQCFLFICLLAFVFETGSCYAALADPNSQVDHVGLKLAETPLPLPPGGRSLFRYFDTNLGCHCVYGLTHDSRKLAVMNFSGVFGSNPFSRSVER